MIKKKRCRTVITIALLFALFCPGCMQTTKEDSSSVALAYTGSKSFEYYDVGNDRNADFLSGRGTEVCIPSTEYNAEVVSGQDYVYGLYRLSNQKILEQSGITDKIYPASTTKLMTALLALENSAMGETVTVSHNAVYDIVNGLSLYLSAADGTVRNTHACIEQTEIVINFRNCTDS